MTTEARRRSLLRSRHGVRIGGTPGPEVAARDPGRDDQQNIPGSEHDGARHLLIGERAAPRVVRVDDVGVENEPEANRVGRRHGAGNVEGQRERVNTG